MTRKQRLLSLMRERSTDAWLVAFSNIGLPVARERG